MRHRSERSGAKSPGRPDATRIIVRLSGPYRLVRHPDYLGSILLMCGTGSALGSWLGIDTAPAVSVVLVLRTALGDGMLRRELDGYPENASRVRFRLVPGIW